MGICFNKRDTGFCDKKLNFLAHAQAIELDIGSECGGHGICGKDQIRFDQADLSNVSPPTSEEQTHLSKQDLQEGWRLACQTFPQFDNQTIVVETKKRIL